MAAYEIKPHYVPFKILTYLLYGKLPWLERREDKPLEVRILTGEAARAFRMPNAEFWNHLHWLETEQLVKQVKKERKRGSVIISLRGLDE